MIYDEKINLEEIAIELFDENKGVKIEIPKMGYAEIHLPFGSSIRKSYDTISSVLVEPVVGNICIGTSGGNGVRGFVLNYDFEPSKDKENRMKVDLVNIKLFPYAIHDMINVLRGSVGGSGQMVVVGPNSGNADMSFITPYADNEIIHLVKGGISLSEWSNGLKFDLKKSGVDVVQYSQGQEVKRDDVTTILASIGIHQETPYNFQKGYQKFSKPELK
ncbi:MAG: hypothetical protein Q8O89_04190 [Nanoarchaeota archaeon]|nr:hypothetical protein [Nanoarchaeota archaeon]